MSKLIQRGTASAMRVRNMASASPATKLTPEQLAEYGRRTSPVQASFGPKDPAIEAMQKFFQDPINMKKPVYRRKGFTDDMIFGALVLGIGTQLAANIYTIVKEF